MKDISVMFSKKTDHWQTPKYIYDQFMKEGYYDPCPLNADFDGLKINWIGKLFINPPYSDIISWVNKAISERNNFHEIIFLVPARTDTKWFHKLINTFPSYQITFIKGRLKFSEKGSAPFPSIFIKIYGNN